MTEDKRIIYRIVAGTATDEDRAQLQHILAEKGQVDDPPENERHS